MPDFTGFEILAGYKIKLTLPNDERGIFCVKPYLEKGISAELKDCGYFESAKIEYGTISRSNGKNLSPETHETKV